MAGMMGMMAAEAQAAGGDLASSRLFQKVKPLRICREGQPASIPPQASAPGAGGPASCRSSSLFFPPLFAGGPFVVAAPLRRTFC